MVVGLQWGLPSELEMIRVTQSKATNAEMLSSRVGLIPKRASRQP